MPENEKVDVIIYRVRETGLEVFLVDHSEQTDTENPFLKAPAQVNNAPERLNNCIELDPVTDAYGEARKAVAIEADWHEIPSLRALMYEDYRVAKEKARNKIKNLLPEMEKGAFVAVKVALKRIMPEQYAFLKELKDIIADKNQAKSV